MVTKRKPRKGPPPGSNTGEGPDYDTGDSTSIFEHMSEDSYVLLHRMHEAKRKWIAHGRIAPVDATEEAIGERFGGGEWRLQERYRDPETGQWRIGRTRTVEIAGPYKPPTTPLKPPTNLKDADVPLPGEQRVAPGGMSIDTAMTAGVLQLFSAQAQMQQAQMQMMKDSSEAQRALMAQAMALSSREGPLDKLLQDPAALVSLIQIFRPEQPKTDTLEMVREVVALMKSTTGQQGSIGDLVGALNEVMDLKDRLGGAPADLETTMAMNIPRILDALSQGKNGNAAPPPSPKAGAPSGERPSLPPGLPPLLQGAMQFLQGVRRYAGRRREDASWRYDPGVYASLFLDQHPDHLMGGLRDLLGDPTLGEKLLAVLGPNLSPDAAEWYEDLLSAVYAGLQAQDDDDTQDTEAVSTNARQDDVTDE